MASMREAAKKSLDKMVKGAAREVNTSRPGASAATKPATVSVFDQLLTQIEKNGKSIQVVPLDNIKLHENIRESYDAEGLQSLADSMQKDGLIQYPTLCLKKASDGSFSFVCKNGHRRILAAKKLGWKGIECVILPFASARDELYHTIAANLREDVFYLDLAQAYQQAHRLGEVDQSIATRVGVNPRTVGWYRRLAHMAKECQALCRQYPQLFHATWAIKLARQGDLPETAALLKQMQFMLSRYVAEQSEAAAGKADSASQGQEQDPERQKSARESLKAIFSGARGTEQAQQAIQLVEELCLAGYVKTTVLNKIKRQLLPGARRSKSKAKAAS